MEDSRSAFVVKAGLDDVESRRVRQCWRGCIGGFDAFMEGEDFSTEMVQGQGKLVGMLSQ